MNNNLIIMKYLHLIIVLTYFGQILAQDWNYNLSSPIGPNSWYVNYPYCGVSNQSPIDIVSQNAVPDSSLSALGFVNYDQNISLSVKNNGHTVVATVMSNISQQLINGGLPGNYTFHKFHLHWGQNNSIGSEHSINSDFSPLVIHLVHYNTKYSSIDAAESANDSNALAVLSLPIALGPVNDNNLMQTFASNMINQLYYGNTTIIKSFNLYQLLPSIKSYYRYYGSLTIPPCYVDVVWSILSTPIYISAYYMTLFRQIYNEDSKTLITYNYRPIQPLKGRTITLWKDPNAAHILTSYCSFPLLLVAVIITQMIFQF